MPLINCKVEIKSKWTKHFVLAVAGAYNANKDSDNIIFTIKDANVYVLVVTLSASDNQNYQNFLAKDFKDQFIGTNINQK